MQFLRNVLGLLGILLLVACSEAVPESSFFGSYPSQNSGNPAGGSVNSGGGLIEGSSYKIYGQIGGAVSPQLLSGSKYRIQVRRED